ncbi:urease accessory protein UreF [Kineosporia succinea]|uniref:Urease accessory protein UreF n=1 Tax=Kineosporia succinea TaxID=84632 RepID=A0ABT9NZC0_9ACTN|nr:urease accessory UreF family protein [Kineosporia succinea]MDP9825775.1 urease accessory protein [Kineosporia succinea]
MFAPGTAALLALADQRLPSGGHVHSGGVEQAITDGLVSGVRSLERFLERRLRTTGLVTAGLAAAASTLDQELKITELDAEADARTPSPAQRLASRAQGRGLLRTAKAAWAAPSATLNWSDLGARPHHPIVLGCAARAGGIEPEGAALAAAYLSVSAPSTAAQRLLALDPVAVAAVTVRLSPVIEEIAAVAVHNLEMSQLPDDSDPLLDLLAERHAAREERLFAS